MFTEKELKNLQSCWIIPDGSIHPVPPEKHDLHTPPKYKNDVSEAEKECVRMSFSRGWNEPESVMSISCNRLTENQLCVIKYLVDSKIISGNQIEFWINDTKDLVYDFIENEI